MPGDLHLTQFFGMSHGLHVMRLVALNLYWSVVITLLASFSNILVRYVEEADEGILSDSVHF